METCTKKVKPYCFNESTPIGQGVYGKVYIAYKEDDPKAKLAVKIMSLVNITNDPKFNEKLLREINVPIEMSHPNIVHVIDVIRTSKNIYIFMEFCDGGDLQKRLQKNKTLSEKQTFLIAKQIASVFVAKAVNKSGEKTTLMHRDIKPANILFHQNRVKIGDFGFAKTIEEADKDYSDSHTRVGTPLYMSLQVLEYDDFSTKCDVWSTGIVLYQVLVGKTPWDGYGEQDLIENIRNKKLKFPDHISEEAESLIRGMLEVKEKNRIFLGGGV